MKIKPIVECECGEWLFNGFECPLCCKFNKVVREKMKIINEEKDKDKIPRLVWEYYGGRN